MYTRMMTVIRLRVIICTKPKLQISVLKVVGIHNIMLKGKKLEEVAESSTFCVEMTNLVR